MNELTEEGRTVKEERKGGRRTGRQGTDRKPIELYGDEKNEKGRKE